MQKTILLILLSVFSIGIYAQVDSSKTGTKVIFFGKQHEQVKKEFNSSNVKFGLFEIASGLYGLHYEHELSDIFGVQGGLGLTGRPFVQGLFDAAGGGGEGSNNNPGLGYTDIPDKHYDYTNRTANIGYFITLMPKLYFSEEGFDGTFFAFTFQFRRYNSTAQNVESNSNGVVFNTTNPISEHENQTIFGLTYGYEWTGDKTILEYSLTAGIRNINGQKRDLWSTGYGCIALLNNYTDSQFYFDMSLKIGLKWDSKK